MTYVMQLSVRWGATIINGIGAYTRTPKQIVMVAVNLLQVNKLKEAIEEVDNEAFILITDAQEVIGKGFTTPIVPTSIENLVKECEENANYIEGKDKN